MPSSSSAIANQTPIQTSTLPKTDIARPDHIDVLLAPPSATSISDQVTDSFSEVLAVIILSQVVALRPNPTGDIFGHFSAVLNKLEG